MEAAKPNGGLTRQEATDIIYKCIEILYYRDAKSWPKFQMGIITKDDVSIQGPFAIQGKWDIATSFRGYE